MSKEPNIPVSFCLTESGEAIQGIPNRQEPDHFWQKIKPLNIQNHWVEEVRKRGSSPIRNSIQNQQWWEACVLCCLFLLLTVQGYYYMHTSICFVAAAQSVA